MPIVSGAGLEIVEYGYYDRDARQVRFDAIMEAITAARAGDIVLLHGCCHNPTGADLDEEQWRDVTRAIVPRSTVNCQTSGCAVPASVIATIKLAPSGESRGEPYARGAVGVPVAAPERSCQRRLVGNNTVGPCASTPEVDAVTAVYPNAVAQ